MFISKIQLDPRKRETAKALQNRELLHSAMESSISGERPHILWRIEEDGSILAVSKEIPDLMDMHDRYGLPASKPGCKEYDAYIEAIQNNDLMKFKLTVNPVINKSDGSKNGKDVPLNLRRTGNYPYSAEDWTKEKLETRGVTVLNIKDLNHETAYFYKNGRKIPLFIVTYTGYFRVVDAELLKDAMKAGIGGKKSYGCGLLTAIRVRESE